MRQRSLRRMALALGMALAPLAATAETLADALISAYRHSNLLEQNRALVRAADEDVAAAVAALRPTLDFVTTFDHSEAIDGPNAAASPNSSLQATFALEAALTLFANGQRLLAREAAKENVLALRDALRDVEQQILFDAVQAFFNVRTAQAFVSLRENNLRLITQELRAARDRFEVGEVTRTDVALAESRLAAARSQLAAVRGDLAVQREAYKAAVGRLPGNLQAPSREPETAPSVEAAKKLAVQAHPLIRRRQREVTVAELRADAAGRAMGPTVSLNGQIRRRTTQQTDDKFDDLTARLTLRQPIYRGGSLASDERRARAQRDQARAVLHQTVLGVEQQVGNAWAQIEISGAQIRAADEQIRAAQIAFQGTREEARLGARTTLDVLDAEQELLDARANRISAENDRAIAIYSLLSAMGLLTVEHLKLGIATYDPAAYYNAVRDAPTRQSRQGRQLDRVLEALGKD